MGTVLGQKQDSPLCNKALEKVGITGVGGITSLTDWVIGRLKYRDDSSGTPINKELGHGYQQLIHCFNAFVLMKNDEGNSIHGDWQTLTVIAKFQEFWIIGFASYTVTQAPPPTMVTPGGPNHGNTPFPRRVRDLVLEFKKGIKRDPVIFCYIERQQAMGLCSWTLKAHTCY
jgi:hypothetical protein